MQYLQTENNNLHAENISLNDELKVSKTEIAVAKKQLKDSAMQKQ